jgi:gluconolactonase
VQQVDGSVPLVVRREIVRIHPDLDRVIASYAQIEELASGGVFDDLGGGPNGFYARSLEGVVWDERAGHVFFSDIGNSRRLRWSDDSGISTLHAWTNHTNGATLDHEWAVISAEHSGRRISRLAPDGSYTVVADRWDGKRLGRCNDVIVRSDGNIYFTAPWWDFGDGDTQEVPFDTFFHVSASGQVTAGPPSFMVPNGLAFSPDERQLLVNDSLQGNIRAYDVAPDGTVSHESERLFFTFEGEGHGTPDGMKVDRQGNVYCGGPSGLWIISPDGRHLGTVVHGATQVNNLSFGGPDWKTLYFCSWNVLFRVPVLVPGMPIPSIRFGSA